MRDSAPARARLADVAARAGVSVGTASKALSGGGRMRPETRERVLGAADELGFSPNRHAQSLHTGRSWTVGLMTTDGIGRFGIPVLLGAEDALGAGKISVLLCDTRGDAIREQHHLRALIERRVDGIIVTGRRTDPRPPLTDVEGIPTVYTVSPSEDPRDTSVVSDDAGGATLAVEHLLGLGRSRIAHVTGPAHHAAARDRAARTLKLIEGTGLAPASGRVHYGDWSEAWGRRAAEAVLRTDPKVDAFFCGNDQIARGVADTLRERGARVPEDVAIVGYDNWDAMALASRPPLTTIDMNLGEIGRVAALHLLSAIDADETQPGVTTVPCRLIVRESA
ncbi:LacI family DNA-binding transcriptional regulator [Actinocrinis puniceicyclus]|uniref:LacI family DNA-binding transcriptional regulator n=1 Tax=Actinocrinis puniceicyclus TaxID=977794 RepID=UPI0034D95494